MATKTQTIIKKFEMWFKKASECEAISDATAMNLATVSAGKIPSSRIVLLKGCDEHGFVFYTNNNSHKGRDLEENKAVALCFYWPQLERQLRIEGKAQPVTPKEADAYFASRSRESQLGAWASQQSAVLGTRDQLMQRYRELEKKYRGQEVPRPAHWSGWRVVPNMIEFWQQGDFRLHQREQFSRKDIKRDEWEKVFLNP